MTSEQMNENEIPTWLKLTNENFQELFGRILSCATTSITIEELQQVAIGIYQDQKHLHEKKVWSTLLRTIESGLHRWPAMLKQRILSLNIVNNRSIEYMTEEMYSNLIHIYLQQPVVERIVQYETNIENMLEKYIDDYYNFLGYDYDKDDQRLASEIKQHLNDNLNFVR